MSILPFLPIASIFFLLSALKLKPVYAYSISFAVTFILALTIYKMTLTEVLTATLDGSVFALYYICVLIFSSLFMFNLIVTDRVKDALKTALIVKDNDEMTALLVTLGLGSLLEAFFGFGVSLIIPLILLVDMGFDKLKSASATLVAMSIPTSFGSLGLPQENLSYATGLNEARLSTMSLTYESVFLFMIPIIIAVLFSPGVIKNVRRLLGLVPISLLYTASYITSGIYISPAFPNIASGLAIIIYIAIISSLRNKNRDKKFSVDLSLFYPIIFVFALLFLPYLVPPLKTLLNKVSFSIAPYKGDNADVTTITPLLQPGIVILIGTLLSIFIFRFNFARVKDAAKKTIKDNWKTFICMCLILSISKLMKYSSMSDGIAKTLITITGSYFPFVSPLLGALGAIITGSNSSTNILFGPIQAQAGIGLGGLEYKLSSFNGIGASIGKIICPQNMILSSSVSKEISLSRLKYCIMVFIAFILLASLMCFFL